MGWTVLVFSLKLLGTGLNVLGSFKALKVNRKRGSSAQRLIGSACVGSKSLTAADRARRKQLNSQLITWTCWISVLQLESFADRVGVLVPLYDELKLILLLALIILRQPVALLIFENVISPLLSPYETPLDAMGYAVEQFLAFVLLLLLWPVRKAVGWWRPSQEQDVPSILAGLRVPNRPSLARDLANTIESSTSNNNRKPRPPPSAPISINQPRKAPAKMLASLSASTSSARQSTDRLPLSRLPTTKAAAAGSSATSRLSESSSSRPASRAGLSGSVASAKTSLYPELSALPRLVQQQQPPVAHSHALAASTQGRARQEAQTASLLAGLSSAPSGQFTSALQTKKSSPVQERVTLPIPPPLAPTPASAPAPEPRADPGAQLSSSPQTKNVFNPQAVLETPIPPGSFFGASRPSTSATKAPFRPTPPASKMLVQSPPPAPAPLGEDEPSAVAPSPAVVDMTRSTSAISATTATANGAATPRQKALSAIADLSPDLDGLGGSLLGVKRKSVAASPIVARRTRKTTNEDDADEDYGVTSAGKGRKKAAGGALSKSTGPFRPTRGTATATGATKRKAAASNAGDTDSLADESDVPPPPVSNLRASRSSRAIKASSVEPAPALSKSRSRATKLAVATTPATEQNSGDSSDVLSLPVPRRKKKVVVEGEEKEGETPVAPVRKARRVLLATKSAGVSDEEVDGVPVVLPAGRRSARK